MFINFMIIDLMYYFCAFIFVIYFFSSKNFIFWLLNLSFLLLKNYNFIKSYLITKKIIPKIYTLKIIFLLELLKIVKIML